MQYNVPLCPKETETQKAREQLAALHVSSLNMIAMDAWEGESS